jgi:hypothetical protein
MGPVQKWKHLNQVYQWTEWYHWHMLVSIPNLDMHDLTRSIPDLVDGCQRIINVGPGEYIVDED